MHLHQGDESNPAPGLMRMALVYATWNPRRSALRPVAESGLDPIVAYLQFDCWAAFRRTIMRARWRPRLRKFSSVLMPKSAPQGALSSHEPPAAGVPSMEAI